MTGSAAGSPEERLAALGLALPQVVNGVSDRSVVGMAALPQDAPVEVELIAEIRG